jgi:hypothetical protein
VRTSSSGRFAVSPRGSSAASSPTWRSMARAPFTTWSRALRRHP